MLRWIAVLLLMLLTALPVSMQGAAFVNTPCPFEPPEDVLVECGTVTLPENRAISDGNQVQIAVAVFRAVGDNPLPDPLFYLDGGPGADTLQRWAPVFNRSFAPFNQRRDVVLFDYRGTGNSLPTLYCNEVLEYDLGSLDQRPEENIQGYNEALEVCHRRLTVDEHIDLTMYRGAILADDLVDLREALGYSEINLLGGSYGTRLALTVLRDHPEGIRSVILDGVSPPQVDRRTESLSNMNRALEELFAACASAPACHEAFPDLRARFYAAANHLNDKPATLEVEIPSLDETYDVLIDGKQFVGDVISALYRTWIIPSLPYVIDQVAAGNYESMRNLVSVSVNSGLSSSLGLRMSIQCNDEYAFSNPENATEITESLSDLVAVLKVEMADLSFEFHDTCDFWGTELQDPIENQAVYSEVPVLIFNGQFDPVTPPGWGELAAQTLPNSTVITFMGAGHGVSLSGSECVDGIALAFLDDPDEPLDSTCADDAIIHWVTLDISNSFADIEALIEPDDQWDMVADNTSVPWNYGMWINRNFFGVLRVVDYASTLSEEMEESGFENLFRVWNDYELLNECGLGDVHLQEFSAQSADLPSFIIRYWVDRRSQQPHRQIFIAFPVTDLSTLDGYSKQLFPELPNCAGE